MGIKTTGLINMNSKNSENDFRKSVKTSVDKIEQAKRQKTTVLAQTTYLGTIGFIFILPVIVGSYLGVWLDNKLKGFSISWTISLIIVGIFIGAINVYLFIKE